MAEHARKYDVMLKNIRLYLHRQASSVTRYALEQVLYFVFGWVPTVVGIGLRGLFYRLILRMDGSLPLKRT